MSQETAPLELLVQLKAEDIAEPAKQRLVEFESLETGLKDIIRNNTGLSVQGQLNLIEEIARLEEHYYPLLSWKTVPNYQQLSATLDLCWRHFLKPKESKHGVRSANQLAVLSLQYYEGSSIKYLIGKNIEYWKKQESEEDVAIQKAVQLCLDVVKNWFEYKLPKWLIGISELQAYVFSKRKKAPGNYSYFCGVLENSFLKGSLSILTDYDVPVSAIRKLERFFSDQDDWSTVEAKLRRIDLDQFGLLPYELKKLRAAINGAEAIV